MRLEILSKLQAWSSLKPVTFITGDAGMGKTTLLHMVAKRINSGEGARCIVTDCSTPVAGIDVGSVEALHPWICAMKELAQPTSGASTKSMATDLALAWVKFIPIVGDVIESTVSTVNIVKKHRSTNNAPPASKEHVFEQCISFFKTASEIQPLVVIVDDAHWSDDSSMNLLFALARFGGDNIRFIVAYRPFDVRTSRNGSEHVLLHIQRELERYTLSEQIELHGMSQAELSELYVQHQRTVGEEQLVRIQKFSAGNPLLALGWSEGGSVAPTIAAVVAERINRLDSSSIELLSMAAVEGEVFTSNVLRTISNTEPLALAVLLRKAETEHGVIRSLGKRDIYATVTPAYEFSNQAIHTHLEQMRSEEERELLHSAVADVLLEEQKLLNVDDAMWTSLTARLAAHLDLADRNDEAAMVNLDLAHRAWQLFAESEAMNALRLAERGLSKRTLSRHMTQTSSVEALKIRALELETRIHLFTRRVPEAVASSTAMRDVAVASGDKLAAVSALILSAQIANLTGRPDDTAHFAQQALQEAEATGDIDGMRGAVAMLGMWHESYIRFDDAIAAFEQCVQLALEGGNDHARATAFANLGRLYQYRNEYEKALHVCDEAVRIFEQHKSWDSTARALNNSGICLVALERLDEALLRYEQALALHEKIGDRIGASSLCTNLGQLCMRRGDTDAAMVYIEQSISTKRDLGDGYGLAIALYSRGMVLAEVKKKAEAIDELAEALAVAQQIGEQWWIQEIKRVTELVENDAFDLGEEA